MKYVIFPEENGGFQNQIKSRKLIYHDIAFFEI